MTTTLNIRDESIRRARREAQRWSRMVDTLLDAFRRSEDVPPSLFVKLEELRNKRDTVVTKVEALKRHRGETWPNAKGELDRARRELRTAWRSVIGTLDREGLFV